MRRGNDKGGGLWAVWGWGMIKREVCGKCEEVYDKARGLWTV